MNNIHLLITRHLQVAGSTIVIGSEVILHLSECDRSRARLER
jgi:hypothetical protein